MSRPSFLDARGLTLLLFGGKGGVGKTTCATAAALHIAEQSPHLSVLLVSVDPAHSLTDSLAGLVPPSNLTVRELDARDCLCRLQQAHNEQLREFAAAGTFLDDEDIFRFLDLSVPGLDELAAFFEISAWVEHHAYDRIVVDTAPSGHTLRLLAIPALLRKWMSMLDAMLGKRRYMRRVFSKRAGPDQLDLLLEHWASSLRRIETLLRDPARCRFVPVTLAESPGVRETGELLKQLRQWRIPVSDVIANQLHPASDCPVCSDARLREQNHLARLGALPEMSSNFLWGVDLFAREVRGRELLTAFWDHAVPVAAGEPAAGPAPPAPKPLPEAPAPHPPCEIRLILFSGKGGVGKTTLACASALRLASDSPGKRVLLLSTDPTHSLSACLNTTIGKHPVPLRPGLTAMEIDAPAEFDALKRRYAGDIEGFVRSVSGGMDLTFDRVVLEKIIDLAPPGLDELMALTRIIDLLVHRRYDLFVIDSASTGHLLRLLELPDVIDQWIRAFFAVCLKYEPVLQLPNFTQELVTLSKNLKLLRKLLRDPDEAALYAVSIPTRMAFEETSDLVAACGRMGISVPTLFLNLLTPPGECPLCSSLRQREGLVMADFRQAFPGCHFSLIYRQGTATGLDRLEELAENMYQTASEETPTYAFR